MELRHLRYFVTVAELGSISRAATKLFMAQPPLSAQIRQLEEEVGANLLVRLPRGVQLTPAGTSFLQDARAILVRTEQATVRAREQQSSQRSTLRIGLMPSATQSLLPGLMRRFENSGLNLRIEAQERVPSSRQLQALRNAEIDLGFIRPAASTPQPEWAAQIDDPYCLAVPQQHPLAQHPQAAALSSLASEVFVAFSRHAESDYFDQTAALCEEAGFTANVRHTAIQFMSVLAMVDCGLGVAIVPASCALMLPPRVRLRPLSGLQRNSRLVLIRSADRMQDTWGQKIVELAAQELDALGQSVRQLTR
jgi:DNA-binding transcriptional LysR family regulator